MNLDDVKPTLVQDVREKFYLQSYAAKQSIDGVKVFEIKNMIADEGDFSEVLRLNEQGCLEILPEFRLRQINRTELAPGSIKAWHFHTKQNELWYVAPSYKVVVGLWDIREGSVSAGVTQKIVLGGGTRSMLFIPKGVAHGSLAVSTGVSNLWYFVDQQFNLQDLDEFRIPWDTKGAAFWQPERD